MSAHRRVGVVFAWQVVLFAVITLSCASSEELEPVVVQPGCAVIMPAELTASRDKAKKPKKPKKPKRAHPSETPCDFGQTTTLDLLVMYDSALLQPGTTEEAIEGWIHQQVVEANRIFTNSGASRVQYELRAIRKVSARLPDTLPVARGQSRVRIQEIRDAWVRGELSILNRHRDAYGADLAMFVTTSYRDRDPRSGGDICGVATLPVLGAGDAEVHAGLSESRPFGDEAFAVIEYQCGASTGRSDFTFAHELGHTLGMNHDPEELAEAGLEPVLEYAFGARLRDDDPPLATVMACRVDDGYDPHGSQVTLGVCNRIPHFSSPHRSYSIPECTAGSCQVVTGSVDEDNASVACERAPTYAAFREQSRNEPPRVVIRSVREVTPDGSQRDVGSEVTSGSTLVITAVATDREEGDLTARIQWVDHRGAVIGTGGSLQVRLLQTGDFPVSARVADSRGLVEEWALPLRVTWPPDAYETQEATSPTRHAVIPFNSHQDHNFHVPGDVDKLRSDLVVRPGDTIRVRLVPLGARAAPLMQVELWFALPSREIITSLGPETSGESLYTISATQMGAVRVRIRNADEAAGMGTDYRIHLERVEPQSVFPRVGPWYNPARSGHGIDFQRTPDGRYGVLWYTYRPDGSPTWYISDPAPIEGMRWRGRLYASTWNGSTNSLEPVGTLEMSFSSDASATFSWSFPGTGVHGSEPFIFYIFDIGGTGVANGTWYPPSESGWGVTLSHQGNVGAIAAYTYDAFGQPTWALGRAEGDPGAWVFGELSQFTAPGLCPSCDGSLPVTEHRNVGTASFRLTDPAAGTGTLSINLTYRAATGSWRRTNVNFVRLTAAP